MMRVDRSEKRSREKRREMILFAITLGGEGVQSPQSSFCALTPINMCWKKRQPRCHAGDDDGIDDE
jgi:hypothetical protein